MKHKFPYLLSVWVDDPDELAFMEKQLAKGHIPCVYRYKKTREGNKVALFRPPLYKANYVPGRRSYKKG